jgi:IS5 family transposase
VIEARRAQLSFAEGLIAEEVSDLWEDWMRPADQVLDDDQLLTTVYEALAKRRPQSRTRGRQGTPAEVVLRLLLLKHMRNWSYEVVEREVRANLVYRSFTRVGGGKVPDDTVMNKWALALGPEVMENLHKSRRLWRGAKCASIRPSSKPTSTIRPTAACWAMECAF